MRTRAPHRDGRATSLVAVGLATALLLAAPAARAAERDERPPAGPEVRARAIASGLTSPVFLAEPDDGTGRLFVVDQPGVIRVVARDGGLVDEPFLDLRDRIVELDPGYDERGLLGLAFHPDFRDNGRFYVYYSAPLREGAPDGWDHTSHLSELAVSEDDPDRADPESERVLLRVDQPYANHNAGHIGFGKDGYLYVPLGDGGNGGDVDAEGEDLGRPESGNAQTLSTLLGSILRLDVDGREDGRAYAIPDDNPYVGEAGARPEIWAHGFRNPYGMSFDLETGEVYAADAGQALWEEVSRVEPGGNHGWNIREGTHCFDPEDFVDPPETCPDAGRRGEPLVDPVVEYQRGPETGSTTVAGVRYRGDDVPALRDRLVVADYGTIRFRPTGVLYAARVGEPGERGTWPVERVRIANALDDRVTGDLDRFVLSVAQDLDGELYVLTTKRGGPAGSTGEVLALEAAGEPGPAAGGLAWWAWAAVGGGGALALLLALAAVAERRRPERRDGAAAR